MANVLSYLDSKTDDGVNTTIQIDRSVKSVKNGLVNYNFKFSVFPENSDDILKLDYARFEVSFRAQFISAPSQPYINPKGNIEVLKMPDEDQLIVVGDPTSDYIKTFGPIGSFFTFASSVNPITTGLSILSQLVKKERTLVGKSGYKKYEPERLTVGLYVNAKIKENDTAAGYYNMPLELKCNPDIEFLIPSNMIIETSKGTHSYMIERNAGKVITRFKKFTTSNIVSGTGIPENSIVFVCESGTYISDNKAEGYHPLPHDYGFVIGNIFERVVVKGDGGTSGSITWKGDRLYPKDHPLTLIKISFVSGKYTAPVIEHIYS